MTSRPSDARCRKPRGTYGLPRSECEINRAGQIFVRYLRTFQQSAIEQSAIAIEQSAIDYTRSRRRHTSMESATVRSSGISGRQPVAA